MSKLISIGITAAIIFVAILILGFIVARLYKRSSKEVSFVRTGFGGEKVILNGGALVLPVLHEVIPVNMNTLRLEVARVSDQSLITKDRMRVDVTAEFYVRVKPTAESIAAAAQTLGKKTLSPAELKSLVEGKFVDALRSVAAEMNMEELHEKRTDFVQKVQQAVSEDLSKNGLELETVSLTGLDQTEVKYFNPQNAFDAEGLTKLTETIEDRRKKRNHIEQDSDLAIKTKNLEAEQARLQISREEEYAKMQQEREISIRRAEQVAEIAAQDSAKRREAEEARIAAEREVELKRIASERDVENENIQKAQALQKARVEQTKAIELAEQEKAIAIAEKSRAESEAKAEADKARAEAVKAEEEVLTVRQIQQAEREKAVELVAAKQAAEKEAIKITVAAEAEKKASNDKAEAIQIAAQADANRLTIEAKAEADQKALSITIVAQAEKDAAQARADARTIEAKAHADAKTIESQANAEARKIEAEAESNSIILLADAAEKQYAVDAEGQRALNEAGNTISDEQRAMQVKMKLIEQLPEIIAQSVKPMEKIDSIKVIQVDGLNGQSSNGAVTVDGEAKQSSMSDQLVNSALRYRSQAPLVDSLLSEIGIKGGDINSIAQSALEQ